MLVDKQVRFFRVNVMKTKEFFLGTREYKSSPAQNHRSVEFEREFLKVLTNVSD